MRIFFVCMFILSLLACSSKKSIEKISFSDEQITEYWHTGKTLPAGVAIQYPPELIEMHQDKY